MGMLVNGQWQSDDAEGFKRDGNQVRFSAGFHRQIGDDMHPATPGRYAMYFNRTCPWSHRASVTIEVKGLNDVVDQVLLEPAMGPENWWFGKSGNYHDPALGAQHLHELYTKADPNFTGRVSVPILWDKQNATIVNNDSGLIARMLNDQFNAHAKFPEVDFNPAHLREEIDRLNDFIGDRLTDGVYRCLLAGSQVDYEQAYDRVFAALDELDMRLAAQRFLLGAQPTEPDWRLFAVLVRFDSVYYSAYRCNKQRIVDFPHLWDYTRDLYQWPRVAASVDLAQIKAGYFGMISTDGLIPKGPVLDFAAPHNRADLP